MMTKSTRPMTRIFTLTSSEVEEALALYVGEKEGLEFGEYVAHAKLQFRYGRLQSATVELTDCPTYPPVLRLVGGTSGQQKGLG